MLKPKLTTYVRPQMIQIHSFGLRSFCTRWWKKNRDIFYPHDFNDPKRKAIRGGRKRGKVKYRTQDPLFIDERLYHIEGGIKSHIDRIHRANDYQMPYRQMSFILYNMAKEGVRDRKVYINFERLYGLIKADKMYPREIFGGLYGCYMQNLSSLEGIQFWENRMNEIEWKLHAREIAELLQAFLHNELLSKSHMVAIFDKYLAKRLLEVFQEQIYYNQAVAMELFDNLMKIGCFHEELYLTMLDAIVETDRILGLNAFVVFHKTMHTINEDPK